MSAENDAASFRLANRASHNHRHTCQGETSEQSLAHLWTPDCADGLVNLGVAENGLMRQEVVEFIDKNTAVEPDRHLAYGSSPKGSPRLRQSLASFLSANFRTREPVRCEDILILSGVTAVIDSLAWSICNEGEGIIIPQPLYPGFVVDIITRARAVVVPASFQTLEGYEGFDDVFGPGINVKALERALRGAEAKGINVRAVLLANPHNPLGRCYPAETIKQIASFCGRNKLHLISDEIYANSVFANPQASSSVAFTSVLALDVADWIDSQFVHVAYGASKDFCANGLRLGMLHSRNQGLLAAVAELSVLASPPYIIQDIWAKMLEDKEFSSTFLATSQQRLAEQYAFITWFLDAHGVPFYRNCNAGMFVWVDLRRYLTGKNEVESLSLHRLAPREEEEYRRRERDMSRRLVANGVRIARGTKFFTEELGWFRVTFGLSREALKVGLERILKTLEEVEQLDYNKLEAKEGEG